MSTQTTAQVPPAERLTLRAQSLRDRLLRLVVDRFPEGVTPNHLTRLRMGLVVLAMVLYIRRAALIWQAVLLLIAGLTDLLDGPLARRRGLHSDVGARLDQHADSLLTAWLVVLSLLEAEAPVLLLGSLAVGQAVVFVSDPGKRALLTRRAARPRSVPRPTLAARLQLALVVAGLWLLLLHAALGWRTQRLGRWLLIGALGATGARVVDNLRAAPARSARAA
ncbi:MAG TPA: CDP-alcohol phosphatidyltransferase family protein [Limnochorda sp.]